MKTVFGSTAGKAVTSESGGVGSVRGARQSLTPDDVKRLESLPRDVGWMLLGGGLMTELIMGLPPFWVLGIAIVYPRIGMPIAGLMRRRTPSLLTATLDFADRYVGDLERRYPSRRLKHRSTPPALESMELPDGR